MKLSTITDTRTLQVIEVNNCEWSQRLNEMGITEGCTICPLRHLGDALLVEVRGCRYVLSKEITERIDVDDLPQ